jgi:photosystem II stability/assembly factor-like uncharacterized protein
MWRTQVPRRLVITVAVIAAATALPPTAEAAGSPVPAGFRVQSVSWPSPSQGWVLGESPCATGMCTTVAVTTDAGVTWSATGAPPAPLAPSGEPGVTSIRFADAQRGWAYGPDLYATADGGHSWQPRRLPGGGRQVLALATAAGFVYLATSPCDAGKFCERAATVWRSPVTGNGWLQVPVRLPVAATQVVLAAAGSSAYVLATQVPLDPDVLWASTNTGLNWTQRPTPCVKANDESLVDVVPVTGDPTGASLALLCVGNPGRGFSTKHVFRSPDTGRTVVDAGLPPDLGIQSRLAASTSTLLVATVSFGDWVYRSPGGRKWETALDLADGGVGWNDPVLTTAQTGYVVYGPAAASADRPATLLRTQDAGATWAEVQFS